MFLPHLTNTLLQDRRNTLFESEKYRIQEKGGRGVGLVLDRYPAKSVDMLILNAPPLSSHPNLKRHHMNTSAVKPQNLIATNSESWNAGFKASRNGNGKNLQKI